MKIQFRERSIELTPSLRDHLERRLDLVLGRFRQRIDRVTVRFSDSDARRGSVAKRCQIGVVLHPRTLDVEDTDVDLFIAADRATDRLARSIARAFEEWDSNPIGPRIP